MTNYIIAGAGPAGLYTAYRLLSSGVMQAGDNLALLEWNPGRVGGRIHSYYFPDASGQYVEAGGMRFSIDNNFPDTIENGHVLLQNLIVKLNMVGDVVPFYMSSPRLYYLRGMSFYENQLGNISLPYNFDPAFKSAGYDRVPPETVFGDLSANFAPGSAQWTRADWCTYFATGQVPDSFGTATFPAGTPIQDMGYWNFLYDQLGDEGFDYVTDGNGFSSNTINWNSADAMQNNTEFGSGSSYSRIQGGYSYIFTTLQEQIAQLGQAQLGYDPLVLDCRVVSFDYDPQAQQFTVTTVNSAGAPGAVDGDCLFLAMPRRSLELLAQGCDADNVLNDPAVKLYLESALDQPAYKVAMLFDQPWWLDSSIVSYSPDLSPEGSGGPTMTDLPLRQIYYFGNDAPGAQGGGPYVLLASYDDMQFQTFWQEMEVTGTQTVAPSLDYQPLYGPTGVDPAGPMSQMLLSQLASVHGADVANIPAPVQVVFQDWGDNPFGAGYHGWAPHYNICQVMEGIRAPGSLTGTPMNLFVIGSCYSFDQAWVEGALCTAESVLQDFFGLEPFCPLPVGYSLICTASEASLPTPGRGSGTGVAKPSGT